MENLSEWLENPYWADYYYNAPSDFCKEYIAMDFYYSDTEDESVAADLDRMEDRLTLADWKYLLQFSTGPERAKIQKRIEEFG